MSCIGATWIGDGPGGTIELIRPLVRDGGLVLIGEPYWITEAAKEAEDALGHGFTGLVGPVDRFTEQADPFGRSGRMGVSPSTRHR